MKKRFLIFIGVVTLTFSTKAQDGFEGYLIADDNDRSKLIEAYINPAMKGLIYGMNSGWYHTAKVHKPFGFDLSIGLNASLVPEKDEMFTLSGLTSINTATGGSITAATVAGSKNETPLTTVKYTDPNNSLITYETTFNAPGGVKEDLPLSAVPTPAIQLSLGLPKEFEVSLRLVPKVGSDDVKGSLFGLGLKKEITSWFGPIDKLPLHVSLLATYSSMNVDYNIEDGGSDVSVTDGSVEFKLNSYTVQALASLNFPIINLYGGLGYGSGSSTLKMLGEYELSYIGQTRTITDPINSSFDAGSLKATVGARLSLGFFKIFADYTLQEYNTLSAGVAVSIR